MILWKRYGEKRDSPGTLGTGPCLVKKSAEPSRLGAYSCNIFKKRSCILCILKLVLHKIMPFLCNRLAKLKKGTLGTGPCLVSA